MISRHRVNKGKEVMKTVLPIITLNEEQVDWPHGRSGHYPPPITGAPCKPFMREV